jgi:hypothetical protein
MGKVPFPQDCTGIFPHLKTISDESFYLFVFLIRRKGEFQAGLVIPTEMVVY